MGRMSVYLSNIGLEVFRKLTDCVESGITHVHFANVQWGVCVLYKGVHILVTNMLCTALRYNC
jgi:hypothetical protein